MSAKTASLKYLANCNCDMCAEARQQNIAIKLTVAEQRRMIESQAGEPCFRMWLTDREYQRGSFADWTAYPLVPGYMAIWRKRSDVDKLLASAETQALGIMLQSRELPDNDSQPNRVPA